VLKDDGDASTVVIGNRVSVLDGEDANVKDITVEDLCASVLGKEIYKNSSMKIYITHFFHAHAHPVECR
jgi:hypothetical protein